MKKLVSSLVLFVVSIALLCACGAAPLPEGMTEESVSALATQTVTALSEKDYTAVNDTLSQEMKDALASQPLADIWGPVSEKVGNFVEISSTKIGASKGFATAVVKAKYENATVQFTLSYNTDSELAGLYFK